MKNTGEVAERLIELCGNNEFLRAEQELYDENVIHIEINGQEFKGFDEVLLKEKQFLENLVNKPVVKISEPIISGDYFSVRMQMEADHKQNGHRSMDELIVYRILNGKIVLVRCYA